jgi:hypothetical protein
MSLIKDFHIMFLNDAQKAVVKQALADAGHVVEVAAESAGDKLVLALKATSVGSFIASEIAILKDATISGAEKMEQVVAKAVPAAIALFAAGGVVKTALEVEDAVRGAAQLIFNDTLSTTVPALVADGEKVISAIVSPATAQPALAA